MGGIKVDTNSKTSMEHLYAAGETSCNGVHGANRLASNSLLETLVFAKRCAKHIMANYEKNDMIEDDNIDLTEYENYEELADEYKDMVKNEIRREEMLSKK